MFRIHPIFRTTFAVVIGLVIAFCVILLTDSYNAKWFPSAYINPSLAEMEGEIKSLPTNAFLFVLGGYILSSFFGAYSAARLAFTQYKLYAGLTVGFVLLLGSIVNFIPSAYPLWFTITASLSFMPFAWLGAWLASK